MSTSYAEIYQEVIKHVQSQRNMNGEILLKLLYRLMKFAGPSKENHRNNARSVLNRVLPGNKTALSTWSKLELLLRKPKRRNYIKKIWAPNPAVRRALRSHVNRSTSPFLSIDNEERDKNGSRKIPVVCIKNLRVPNNETISDENKVPVVPLTDVLTTQGSISKINYMQYFGLGKSPIKSPPRKSRILNIAVSKTFHNATIPISSNLGKLLGENHRVSEDFKLRKINRAEWYINKTCVPQEKPSITSKSKPIKSKKRGKSKSRKSCTNFQTNSLKLKSLLKLCKPVKVSLPNMDLLKEQRRQAFNAKRRKIYLLEKNLNLCKKVSVHLTVDKEIEDIFDKKN